MHINIIEISASPGRHAEQLPHRYFLRRFLDDYDDEIQELNKHQDILQDVKELVEEYRSNLNDKLDFFENEEEEKIAQEVVFPRTPIEDAPSHRTDFLGDSVPTWQFDGPMVEDKVIFSLIDEVIGRGSSFRYRKEGGPTSTLLVLSNSMTDSEEFIDLFSEEVSQLETLVGNFIQVEEFKHGENILEDYLEDQTDNEYVTGWYIGESEDDFEETVFDYIKDLTGICMKNVKLELQSGESEYDIVAAPLGRFGEQYAIEVKDFDRDTVEDEQDEEGSEVGGLRYQLLTQPQREAGNANLKLITIVNGLEEERFDDVERHAGPNDGILLNENNFKETVKEVLISDNLESLSEKMQK